MKRVEKNMRIRTVKVSDKGQISIPIDIRNSLGLRRGDELILIQIDNKILMEKPVRIAKKAKTSFRYLLKHSEKVASKLWENKEDEVWDTV
jgi:AbrB family looped-hinge helix DNA binding protein